MAALHHPHSLLVWARSHLTSSADRIAGYLTVAALLVFLPSLLAPNIDSFDAVQVERVKAVETSGRVSAIWLINRNSPANWLISVRAAGYFHPAALTPLRKERTPHP